MKLVSSFIIPLQQQEQKNSRTEKDLKEKKNTQEKDRESCYVLFLSLSSLQAQQSSAGYQSTQAPNHSLHVPNWGTWRQKDVTKAIYYLIRSYISESALQSVTASLTILPLLSEASLIQATSTLSI